jgi:hypothetical protein
MNLATQVAVLTSLLATTVALGTWGFTQWRLGRAVKRESRRQLVSRVLDVVDALVKQRTLPVLLIAWRRKEIDLALLQTRLVLDLPKKDQVIAKWVWAQTERLVIAKDESEVTRRAIAIGGALSLWHQGFCKRKWFKGQLALEPVIEELKISAAAKWRLSGRNFREVLALGVIASALGFAVSQAKRTF